MKTETKRLSQMFQGDAYYVIPIYQRNYDWKPENCEQLFRDVVALKCKSGNHFLGCIFYMKDDNIDERCQLIDGQQRMLTLSLLYKALMNRSAKENEKATVNKCRAVLFKPNYEDPEQLTEPRLVPGNKDLDAYKLILSDSDPDKISRVTTNYNLFVKLLDKTDLSVSEFYECLSRLEAIVIKLKEGEDDPQLIFESLNSTGLLLRASDNIRNYLLMDLPHEEQTKLYTEYWSYIESCDSDNPDNPEIFVRDYLTVKMGAVPKGKMQDIYRPFKAWCARQFKTGLTKKVLLADMKEYATTYRQLKATQPFHKAENAEINARLLSLAQADFTRHYPFCMPLLHGLNRGELAAAEVLEVLDVLEGYIARRLICRAPTNGLNKAFPALWNEIVKHRLENNKSLAENLRFSLLQKAGSSSVQVMSDDLVRQAMRSQNIYDYKNTFYLLQRLCNADHKPWNNELCKLYHTGQISIEHIMPQKLTAEWEKELGANAKEVHRMWVHTIANLTLTGYNSEYSDRSFKEKLEGFETAEGHVDGFKKSIFLINESVRSHSTWNEADLEQRLMELTNTFLRIFPYPTSKILPKEPERDVESLDDEELSFTNRKLKAFIYNDEVPVPCKKFKNLLVQVCKRQYAYVTDKVIELCRDDTNKAFTVGEKPKGSYTEFAPGCYVRVNSSGNDILNRLRLLFRFCDVDASRLQIEFVPLTQSNNNEEADEDA